MKSLNLIDKFPTTALNICHLTVKSRTKITLPDKRSLKQDGCKGSQNIVQNLMIQKITADILISGLHHTYLVKG